VSHITNQRIEIQDEKDKIRSEGPQKKSTSIFKQKKNKEKMGPKASWCTSCTDWALFQSSKKRRIKNKGVRELFSRTKYTRHWGGPKKTNKAFKQKVHGCHGVDLRGQPPVV